MNLKINISERIYWLGTNDRRKELFENLWPLPRGVAYNSYLIVDQKTALLDTVEMGTNRDYAGRIEYLLKEHERTELDYLIVNHMEPDHAGEIAEVVRRWPNVQVVGNSKTFQIMRHYYPQVTNTLEVNDGDRLRLGEHELSFVLTPFVHWPETMMTYDMTDGILFSGDAFGSFGTLDGGIFDDEIVFDGSYEDEMRRYYSNIVGKYGNMVQKAFEKIHASGFTIKTICSTHGPVWRSDPGKALRLYDQWSRCQGEDGVVIVYGSMYGNNAQTADYVARRCVEAGIGPVKVFDVSKTHVSYLISEIWKYRGVILGSCAYNTCLFPQMEHLTTELLHYAPQNKLLGLFGSYSWSGGGVRNLKTFAESIGWPVVAEPVDIQGTPVAETLRACDAIATGMAEALGLDAQKLTPDRVIQK